MRARAYDDDASSGRRQRRVLPLGHARDRELPDCFVEQPVEIKLGAQVQKHAAESDRGPVHEHEFARDPDRPFFLQGPMH
jgi:hypothetical protein